MVIGAVAMFFYGRSYWVPIYHGIVGKRTVQEVISIYGTDARERLKPYFTASGENYPPQKITLLAIKDTSILEVWSETAQGPKFIRSYQIQGLSGVSGPKLREGDKQVPEGFYDIEGLNPNSFYHLSMKLNYPNAFDLKHAKAEGRDSPGSNIFIHGKAVSIGCLAMGDSTIEELFVLTTDIGRNNLQVAIAPSDPRVTPLQASGKPLWVSELYQKLNVHFSRYVRSDT